MLCSIVKRSISAIFSKMYFWLFRRRIFYGAIFCKKIYCQDSACNWPQGSSFQYCQHSFLVFVECFLVVSLLFRRTQNSRLPDFPWRHKSYLWRHVGIVEWRSPFWADTQVFKNSSWSRGSWKGPPSTLPYLFSPLALFSAKNNYGRLWKTYRNSLALLSLCSFQISVLKQRM